MEPITQPTPASITQGLLTRPQLAADLNVSERTVIRHEHAGLPVIRVGMSRYYNPASVRDWLLTHERRHRPVKAGRPANNRAA